MLYQETLEMLGQAVNEVLREEGLSNWKLDNEITSPYSPHPRLADTIFVYLVDDTSYRLSLEIETMSIVQKEGTITVEGLKGKVTQQLQELSLIPPTQI